MKLRIAPAEVLRWVSSGLGWHSTRNWKEGWTYSGESAGRSDRAGRLSEGVPEHGARSTGRSPPLKEKCQLQNVFCNRQRGDYRREEMSGLETTRFFAGTVDRGNSGSRRRGRWSPARALQQIRGRQRILPPRMLHNQQNGLVSALPDLPDSFRHAGQLHYRVF